jgi:hypothetical protein
VCRSFEVAPDKSGDGAFCLLLCPDALGGASNPPPHVLDDVAPLEASRQLDLSE